MCKRAAKKPSHLATIKCFLCDKLGHYKRDCPQLKRQRSDSDDNISNMDPNFRHWQPDGPSISMVFQGSSVDSGTHEWMLDSGSDVHVCIDSGSLLNAREDDGVEFATWNGAATRADLVGDVQLRVYDQREQQTRMIMLNDVRFTGSGATNILSLHQLGLAGWSVRFAESGPKKCWLMKGDCVLELLKRQRRYVMATFEDECGVMAIARRETIALWHRRLAHAHYQTIKEGVSSGSMRGVCLADADQDEIQDCVTCLTAKSKRMSFKNTKPTRSQVAYEKLMTDVCFVGTTVVASAGGSEQFQIVTGLLC